VYVTQLFATDMGLPAHVSKPKKRQVSQWVRPGAAMSPAVANAARGAPL
jgi:hypothetical protein